MAWLKPVDGAVKAGGRGVGADPAWGMIGRDGGLPAATCRVAAGPATRAFRSYRRAS